MARISAPLDTTIPPPWLITGDQLLSLDRILDSFADRLNEERERQIQSATEHEIGQMVKAGYPRDKAEDLGRQYADTLGLVSQRSVTIYLRGGRTIEGRNFSEAVNLPNVTGEIALGFRVSLVVAKIKATIDFGSGWLSGDRARIDVDPEDSPIAQELFGVLQNWAADVQAPPWERLWRKHRGLVRFLLFSWIVIGFFLWGGLTAESAKANYKAEARQLLDKGISQENQQRALELLLAIESEYSPPSSRGSPGPRFWGYYIAVCLILGVLSISPTRVIGIWKGKEILGYWRLWIRTVWVTIPGLILTTILWPIILRFFGVAPTR